MRNDALPRVLGVALVLAWAAACNNSDAPTADPVDADAPVAPHPGGAFDPRELAPGGDTTVELAGILSFRQAAANLRIERRRPFEVGRAMFEAEWVPGPATGFDGLGPMFNVNSCLGCHEQNGRARPPRTESSAFRGLLLRLVPSSAIYGAQLQDQALAGVPAEARLWAKPTLVEHTWDRGQRTERMRPEYGVESLAFGPLEPGTVLSPRIASVMVGLGLLEAIDESDILAWADENDADGDGIAGRPSWVTDGNGARVLGRFGWKAGEPSLRSQSAVALHEDMGLTSNLHPVNNCTSAQEACKSAFQSDELDLADRSFDSLVEYMQLLGVPARRDAQEPEVLQGKQLFFDSGCASCHRPTYTTRADGVLDELRAQTIWPYSDLLLHDMGAELGDDDSPQGRAFRTPPLWGLGLVREVNEHESLLHDGRARTLEEAILWHGGEASAARIAYERLPVEARRALLRFVRSL